MYSIYYHHYVIMFASILFYKLNADNTQGCRGQELVTVTGTVEVQMEEMDG
jgi:hypothetical protein